MCKALEFANEINTKVKEAQQYYKDLIVKEKLYNDMQQDILHKVEFMDKFDLYLGWKMTKSLNKLRTERRQVKNELYNMKILIDQLNTFNINSDNIKKSEQKQKGCKYSLRQIDIKDEPLETVKKSIDIINKNDNLTRTSILKQQEKIYYVSSKIPKTKGIDINIKYRSEKEKKHILNNISLQFKECRIDDKKQCIKLIERK